MDKKLRLIFEKRGLVCFISHKDLMQLFEKSFRIAKLPVEFSKGFNPHPRFSIAIPLPVGVEGKKEYIDIEIQTITNPQRVKNQLNKIFPEGIRIKNAYLVRKDDKEINFLTVAIYIIKLSKPINEEGLHRWIEENPSFTRTTKSGLKKVHSLKDSLIKAKLYCKRLIMLKVNISGGISLSTLIESMCSHLGINITEISTIRRIELHESYKPQQPTST